jgi:hypothetical protein
MVVQQAKYERIIGFCDCVMCFFHPTSNFQTFESDRFMARRYRPDVANKCGSLAVRSTTAGTVHVKGTEAQKLRKIENRSRSITLYRMVRLYVERTEKRTSLYLKMRILGDRYLRFALFIDLFQVSSDWRFFASSRYCCVHW